MAIGISFFVYSSMQVEEKKKVNKSISRDFRCGEVSVGSTKLKFSDIMNSGDELVAYKKQYPDAKIITKGMKNKMTYTSPTTPYIGSGKE